MENSWGVLGKPTPEKIAEWQNMPYGQFKNMVTDLKKKSKGKTLSKYEIRIRKIQSTVCAAYHTVEAFTPDLAIKEVQKLDKNLFKWREPTNQPDKYEYKVTRVE